MTIRIALVDDNQAIHDVVSRLLKNTDDMSLVGQSFRGDEAVQLCSLTTPDIVLMDVVMPGMGGPEATALVIARFPNTKVLALSSFREYEYILDMLTNGATGYLVKDVLADDLVSTIHATVQGNTVLSPDAAQAILSPPPSSLAQSFSLTKREQEVLELMARGLNNSQIAHELDISVPTVRFHLTNIIEKMDVQTRSEVLVLAAKHNLI